MARNRWWLCVGLAAVALLAIHATASATGMSAVELEHLDELTQWAYRNGATDTAPACEAVCTKLWLSEHRPMPNQVASSQLWAELTTLEEASVARGGIALLPAMADAIPTIALGIGSFQLGWKIGGRIRHWLGIDVPAKPAAADVLSLLWVEGGETWPFGTYHDTVAMPYDGYAAWSSHSWGIVAQSSEAQCGSPTPPPTPPDFIRLAWYWNDCFTGYFLPLVPITAYGFVLKPQAALANPIQDFTTQTVDIASMPAADPGAEVIQERLVDALESGDYPVLNQWLDHQLGGSSDDPLCEPLEGARAVAVPAIMPGQTVGDYEDCLDTLGLTEHVRVTVPVGQAVLAQPARGVVAVSPDEGTSVSLESETQIEISINPDPLPDPSDLEEPEECHLSSGSYPVEPPPNDPSPEPFDQITDASLVASPTFPSTEGNTVLRWGDVNPALEFRGWGYTHIEAKHGWSRADDAATRSALLMPGVPHPTIADSWIFIGPEYEQSGVDCVREVVVNRGVQGEDPDPKGIITSYGRDVTRLPAFMRPG